MCFVFANHDKCCVPAGEEQSKFTNKECFNKSLTEMNSAFISRLDLVIFYLLYGSVGVVYENSFAGPSVGWTYAVDSVQRMGPTTPRRWQRFYLPESTDFVGPGRILDNILENGLNYYLFYTHNAKHVLSDHIASGHYLYHFPYSCEIFQHLQMFCGLSWIQSSEFTVPRCFPRLKTANTIGCKLWLFLVNVESYFELSTNEF